MSRLGGGREHTGSTPHQRGACREDAEAQRARSAFARKSWISTGSRQYSSNDIAVAPVKSG
jgi:hypothetical protein